MTRDEALDRIVLALKAADDASRRAEEAWLEVARLRKVAKDAWEQVEEAKIALDDLLRADAGLPVRDTKVA